MGNVTTGSKYSSTTKYTTTPNGKTFKIEVGEGGINEVDESENMSSFLTALGAKGVDLGAQIAGGYISDMFNQRSEERADKRNRALIRDTAQLQVEGRRKAGLNPYTLEGAQLPGMTAQSSTDTSSNSNFMNDLMMSERLELDKALAESQIAKNNADANKANADANRVTGQESRDIQAWETNFDILKSKAKDERNKAELSYYERLLKEYTLENDKALSDEELKRARSANEKLVEEIALTTATRQEKEQAVKESIERQALLEIQRRIQQVTGLKVAYATIAEKWASVNNLNADQQLKYAGIQEIADKRNLLQKQSDYQDIINAETPKNMRVERWNKRVGMITNVADTAIRGFAAFCTGGVSEVGSSIVSASTADAPAGVFDAYGNPIR